MRIRSAQEIEKAVLANFNRDFPGEEAHSHVFSLYILDCYCRTVENYEICRQMLMKGIDIDL